MDQTIAYGPCDMEKWKDFRSILLAEFHFKISFDIWMTKKGWKGSKWTCPQWEINAFEASVIEILNLFLKMVTKNNQYFP